MTYPHRGTIDMIAGHQPSVEKEVAASPATPALPCHTDSNYTLLERASYRSIPGHPRWGLAPLETDSGEPCVL
jgi:hypothetical protein